MQSLGQLDILRKALGVAAAAVPIEACQAVGVELSPSPATPQPAEPPQSGSNCQH